MGCMTCGGGVIPITAPPFINGNNITLPCVDYDFEKLTSFYNKLMLVQATDQLKVINLTPAKFNSYVGFVASALNYPKNYCFFKQQLDEISQVILLIDAL